MKKIKLMSLDEFKSISESDAYTIYGKGRQALSALSECNDSSDHDDSSEHNDTSNHSDHSDHGDY